MRYTHIFGVEGGLYMIQNAGGVRQMPYLAITHEKKSIIFSSARIDYFPTFNLMIWLKMM